MIDVYILMVENDRDRKFDLLKRKLWISLIYLLRIQQMSTSTRRDSMTDVSTNRQTQMKLC